MVKEVKKACPNCGKKLSMLKTGLLYRQGGKRFCSIKCKGEFSSAKTKDGKVKEMKCKCKQCGKVWHYLETDEKQLRTQSTGNALIGCGLCCNPFAGLFLNKANELKREADKFKKCPVCGSGDITKEVIQYEKKA